MKWKKYRIKTTTQAEELIGEMLSELGVTGVEIEDNIPLTNSDTKAMFIDILPELPPDEGVGYVSFYTDIDGDDSELLSQIRDGIEELKIFVDVGEAAIEASETEDKDWVNNWKQYFYPFLVDDIIIKPTWEDVPADMKGSMVVNIDPGTAFGTGMHETTQLVIKQLKKHITPGVHLLDVGCGSGILAIIALMLGAKDAVGTDLDENAVTASYENMIPNHIDTSLFKVIQGNIIDDEAVMDEVGYECYDVVTANILADVIMPLSKVIAKHIKHGGVFITSGIINLKEKEVYDTISANPEFDILEVTHQGEWVSITARRK